MTPRYREMVLGKDLTPVGELSAAFLTPKTDQHLQFAYYESALVVEFLADRFGLESLKRILRDLAEGAPINDAIARHTAPLDQFEKNFAAFAKERAEKLGPGLDWEKPERRELLTASETELKVKYPNNFYVLIHRAQKLLREKKWEEAKAPLQKVLDHYPANTEPDNAYELLAMAHRSLGETNQERQVLEKLAALDADALDAYVRLMELANTDEDWGAVTQNAERFLAVNPLLPQPYRYLGLASEATGRTAQAIQAYRTLLLLDPPDPADAHFRLARLLHGTRDPSAKRHVLQALEEAPRFREAHRLLLQISRANSPATEAPPAATPGEKIIDLPKP
jgi:tetratricopeptide (TPR) repeat protein